MRYIHLANFTSTSDARFCSIDDILQGNGSSLLQRPVDPLYCRQNQPKHNHKICCIGRNVFSHEHKVCQPCHIWYLGWETEQQGCDADVLKIIGCKINEGHKSQPADRWM